MEAHIYRVGQTVRFVRDNDRLCVSDIPMGDFRIVGVLPAYNGMNLYRVASADNRQQFVVTEDEIASL